MKLFKPKWQSKNVKKACDAVNKISDDHELLEIVLKAELIEVRREALRKIANPQVVITLFNDLKSSDWMNLLPFCVLDSDFLLVLLKNIDDSYTRNKLLFHLKPEHLFELATYYTSQAALLDLCNKGYHLDDTKKDYLRAYLVAIAKLNDIEGLSAIISFKGISNLNYRKDRMPLAMAALNRIEHQVDLYNILMQSDFKLIIDEIMPRIIDQNYILKIVVAHPFPDVRNMAIGKITDQSLIAEIIINEKQVVYEENIRKITDLAILMQVLKLSKNNLNRVTVYKVLQLPGYQILDSLVEQQRRKDRVVCAEQWIAIAKENPEPLKYLWDYLGSIITAENVSLHDNCGAHSDIGIGIAFLPYPFKD